MKATKLLWITLVVMVAIVALYGVSGCETFQASTPQQQYAQVNDTFIATLQVLLVARGDEVITESEWQSTVLPLINTCNDLLDEYYREVKEGRPGTNTLSKVRIALGALRPFVARMDQ